MQVPAGVFRRAVGAAFAVASCACGVTTQPAPRPIAERMPELARYQLIPFPAHIEPKPDAFLLTGATTIAVSHLDDEELRSLADYGADLLRTMTGVNVAISDVEAGGDMDGTIALVLSRGGPSVSPEAYHLAVTPASITISAAAHPGLFYGLQTLRQLLPSDGSHRSVPQGAAWAVPAVEITDQPRFQYRGMHLDVGRHFFPVPFIKNYIDLLAMYKMNTFHWHLTEDQGWRIEIKKYPRLTEVGGFRKETILEKNFDPYIGDGIPYGGFYTQEEIREVVAHARARYVAVIPEIEMPGHSTAALAAYPEFACTEGPFEVSTKWGVHQDIYCPSEETFAFLQDVLTEVMDLFPSRYIHIGGDEAPKIRWQESQLAQDVIRREGLTDEHELQSYFIKRIEEFLLTNGRRLIGWDEILEGGLAPEATVMSWRGMRGGIEAAREGHDVIMTPTSHVYFDYYQGDPENEPLAIGGYTPLERVYEFEPVPTELTAEEAEHVLGAQGNVWTEYMKTTDYVEYMVVPRLLALAEVVWSTTEMRYWDWFAARLQSHFRRLDDLDINYRIPHVRGLEQDRITLDNQVTVSLSTLIPGAEIRYTIDGTDPTPASPPYTEPLRLPVDEEGVVVTARAFLPNGSASRPRSARFAKTSLRPATTIDAERLSGGMRYAYYEVEVSSVDELAGHQPAREGIAQAVSLQGFERDERFGLVLDGYIRAPADGVYTFYLTSDDGSKLTIGEETVVDHDGYHGASTKQGMIALQAGYHPITVRFFQGGGGRGLRLAVARGDRGKREEASGWLFHRR